MKCGQSLGPKYVVRISDMRRVFRISFLTLGATYPAPPLPAAARKLAEQWGLPRLSGKTEVQSPQVFPGRITSHNHTPTQLVSFKVPFFTRSLSFVQPTLVPRKLGLRR